MVSPTIAAPRPASTYLRSPRFDIGFVVGLPLLGLLSAGIVVARPSMWALIVSLDIWLLGFHHVISTYTRMGLGGASDTDARRLWLLFPVTASIVAVVGYSLGAWALATTYLYWQWWHYSRQSWGINRVLAKKSGRSPVGDQRLAKAAFYLVPVWAILWRSAQRPEVYLGIDVWTVPVPWAIVTIVGVGALVAVGLQGVEHVRAWKAGELPAMQTLYLVSHHLMFVMAYIVIDDVSHGWLAINVWHNAQYIGFVWLFNNKRFTNDGAGLAGGERAGAHSGAQASILARLSQRPSMIRYLLACFAVSTVAYLLLGVTIAAVVAPIVVYQTINFHHYVVDSVIWKVRTPTMQRTLDLQR